MIYPYSPECVEGVFSEVRNGAGTVATCLVMERLRTRLGSGLERRKL